MVKNVIIAILVIALAVLGILNIHIIRTADGFEFTSKDKMSFQDTYADVRQWGLADYFSHSPKIRNYLLEKKYDELVKLTKTEKKTIRQQADDVADAAKKTVESVGEKVKDLLSD
jgi:preprotein translocase subunit SecF